MVRGAAALALILTAGGLAAPSSDARAQQSPQRLESCRVGQRVIMPGGYPGTVSAVYGTGGCTVRDDARGLESSWAAFMLAPAPGTAAARAPQRQQGGGAPAAGNYQCFGGTAGNLRLTFGPGNTYANAQGSRGRYSLRPSGQMQFDTGPWAGFYGRSLGNGRVGLTSTPDGTFYQMTCDRR